MEKMNNVKNTSKQKFFRCRTNQDQNLLSELSLIEFYINYMYLLFFCPFRVKWNSSKRCYQFRSNVFQSVRKFICNNYLTYGFVIGVSINVVNLWDRSYPCHLFNCFIRTYGFEGLEENGQHFASNLVFISKQFRRLYFKCLIHETGMVREETGG